MWGGRLSSRARIEPGDSPKLEHRAQEIHRAYFAAAPVSPAQERKLDNSAGAFGPARATADLLEIAGDEFDVENPPAVEGIGQERSNPWADAHELGTALGVIDRKAETDRGGSGETAAKVMAGGAAANVVAKQANARAEEQVAIGRGPQRRQQSRKLVERSGQVGIEVADGFRRTYEQSPQSVAHGFGLALISGQIDGGATIGKIVRQGTDHRAGSIGAAVIDQEEAEIGVGDQPAANFLGGKPGGFVITGHDDPVSGGRSWSGVAGNDSSFAKKLRKTIRSLNPPSGD